MHDFYDRAGAHSYWKLNDGNRLDGETLRSELYWNNFRVLKTTPVARLRTLYVRSQRGMPSYEGVSLLELKRLAAQREISPAP